MCIALFYIKMIQNTNRKKEERNQRKRITRNVIIWIYISYADFICKLCKICIDSEINLPPCKCLFFSFIFFLFFRLLFSFSFFFLLLLTFTANVPQPYSILCRVQTHKTCIFSCNTFLPAQIQQKYCNSYIERFKPLLLCLQSIICGNWYMQT